MKNYWLDIADLTFRENIWGFSQRPRNPVPSILEVFGIPDASQHKNKIIDLSCVINTGKYEKLLVR